MLSHYGKGYFCAFFWICSFIVYTSKHSSWVNQIEIWFGIINRKLLKRSSYHSIEEMARSILKFIEQYNLTAKAFNWKYAG